AVGKGAVESLDFSVGLRPIGSGAFGCDVQFGAGITPGVGPIRRSVVGQNALHNDSVFGEPRRGPLQHADRRGGFLIGADLGVGHPGVVVDDGVYERDSDLGPVAVAAFTGASGSGAGVGFAVRSAEELVPAAIGDVGELGDID